MKARIYDTDLQEEVLVQLTELAYDSERECVVCPGCGEALECMGECGYERKCSTWGVPDEPQWISTCWKYVCHDCGAEFYSAEEV